MSDTFSYHTVEELRNLSLSELKALWELVPTERQRLYKVAYEREVQAAGAGGSDVLESGVNKELLRRYVETALVPSGSRWARTPTRLQDRAREGEALTEGDGHPKTDKPSTKVLVGMGMAGALLLLFFMIGRGGKGAESALNVTVTPTLTPTPEVSPTPTPLALEAQDDVIQGGDRTRAVAYPVNLQVTSPDDQPPRVWVVQRRVVGTSEWNYDENPDTASFVNGMSVRPVIGIPWSEENAAWFASLGEGASFKLTMNTGAVLRYEFAERSQVRRSDTGIFRQVSPGLVLLLIGETDEEGMPTATRPLIRGYYPPEQELAREGELVELNLPILEPTISALEIATSDADFTGVHVDVISVTYAEGQLVTSFRLFNGGKAALPITPDAITLALGYSPNPPGPFVPAEGLQPFDLLPEQAADLTLIWNLEQEPYAVMKILDYTFAMEIR